MQDLVLPEGYGWEMTDGLYKRQAFKTINNKVVLKKKNYNNNKSALASNWPQIPWNAKKTKSPMMYKIIHELFELFPIIQGNTNT